MQDQTLIDTLRRQLETRPDAVAYWQGQTRAVAWSALKIEQTS